MLMPAEVEVVLTALRRFDNQLTRVARLLFCFGFACGLRRAEVLYLKKTNLRLDGIPYIALRHTIDRTLKSTRGRRNVPLELFWPNEELTLLQDYCQSDAVRNSELLFYDKKLALTALGLLTCLMKETTQQPDLVFHQLRHSFLNWCFWLLHLPRIDPKCTPVFFRHPWLGYNRAEFLRKRLGLASGQLGRRDLHVFSILAGHGSPSVTLHSYVHISDLVNAVVRSSHLSAKNHQVIYKTPEHDHDVLASATRLITQALKTEQMKSGKEFPLNLLGQAIFQLSGSRHVKSKDRVPASLVTAVQSVQDKNNTIPKVRAVLTNVMRKKVPLRVIAPFNSWLRLLDETQWALHFSQCEVEQIINLTDPGKDFLFICRTLDDLALLVRWLEHLQINPHDISYRLTLAARCHIYTHSQNPLQQITSELVSDLHAGLLKNLAAPKGRAKKRQPVNQPIDQSTMSQHKLFTCEVHVRWDDIGNGVRRRNQVLIGVLKAMWISWSLRETL
ncbi:MAG: tyrosine-type recombinase/integrase [Gammaproteobacteria bacterium]|nr:tyrosine-type recombinase/integrase [Gammaproteobacteria bacterium]